MYMQSNEPFSRVDQGMSPMASGMLGALALGAGAGIYNAAGYASYSGLEAGLENLKTKHAAKTEQLSNMKQYKNNSGMGVGGLIQDVGLAAQEKVASTRASVTERQATGLARDAKNNRGQARAAQEAFSNGEGITRSQASHMDKYKDNTGKVARNLDAKKQQLDAHRQTVSGIQQKRADLRTPGEAKETFNYKRVSKKADALQEKINNYDLEGRKTSHHWHGTTGRRVAGRVGGFAAAGFVVGGGIQAAVNGLSN